MSQQRDTNEKPEEKKKSTKKKEEPPPPKKIRWMTRAMAEDFTREDILYTTFIETILYLMFMFCVTMFIIARKSPVMYQMTHALESQFLNVKFPTTHNIGIRFKEIRSVNDIWHFTEGLLIRTLYTEYFYDSIAPITKAEEDDRKILFENELLGVPRIRQLKVRNDSCIIHDYFKRLFLTCYDIYRPVDEDFEPFGLENGTAWVYNTPNQTQSMVYSGLISKYEPGGYYIDLGTTSNETMEIISNLKKNLWIRRGTRVVFIDFSTYNMNADLFCICKLIFEMPPTGGVVPSYSFRTFRLPYYFGVSYLDVFEYISYGMGFYFLLEELREIIYFKFRYFLQFWTYIDVLIVVMIMTNFYIFTEILIRPKLRRELKEIQANPDKYANMEYIGDVTMLYSNFNAALLFFAYIKIFKYLSFNKTMGQLNSTLRKCALDIFGFSVMFFIIFFAFAELGYLLFGSQVELFSSFGVAMFTLLRTILGDFDYKAIEQANRILAPLYFLSYIFFVFFVLLNMFLAIINDTYGDVKTEIAIAPEEMQMTDFLRRGIHNILQKFGCKIKFFEEEEALFKHKILQIHNGLLRCGFSEEEIVKFFANYNIDFHGNFDQAKIKKVLDGLEEKARNAQNKLGEDTTPVRVQDFMAQRKKRERVEKSIQELEIKVDTLLNKLQSLEK